LVVNAASGPSVPKRYRDGVRAAIFQLRNIADVEERRVAERSIRGRIAYVGTCNPGQGKMSAKQAEFLLLDQFEWSSIAAIGCHNAQTADKVSATLKKLPGPHPQVVVENSWYY
jgi:hypothetical protein